MTTEKIIRSVNIYNENNIKLINKKRVDDVYISSNKELCHYVVINTMTINENCVDYVLLDIDIFDYLKEEYKDKKILNLLKLNFYTNKFFFVDKYPTLSYINEINDFLSHYDEYFTNDLRKNLVTLLKQVRDFVKSHQDDINYMK